MSKFYYIVKGATKGDNVGEFEADDKEAALTQLNEIYDAKAHGLTVRLLNKPDHDSEQKRINAERLEEANQTIT